MLPLCQKLGHASCRCDQSEKTAVKSFYSVDACMARAYALGHRYFGYDHKKGRCEIYTRNEVEQCLIPENVKGINEGGYESFRISLCNFASSHTHSFL